jgi:hypothetical protein
MIEAKTRKGIQDYEQTFADTVGESNLRVF